MIYQLHYKRHTLEKNRTFNSPLLKNVILVKEMVLNQAQVQIDVLIVEEMEELDLTKVSLQFNKLVLSVRAVVKKLLILAGIVTDKAINKQTKKYLLQFPKVLMMAQE